jgi:hypothetical protein
LQGIDVSSKVVAERQYRVVWNGHARRRLLRRPPAFEKMVAGDDA